jgi:hypothetical protein
MHVYGWSEACCHMTCRLNRLRFGGARAAESAACFPPLNVRMLRNGQGIVDLNSEVALPSPAEQTRSCQKTRDSDTWEFPILIATAGSYTHPYRYADPATIFGVLV